MSERHKTHNGRDRSGHYKVKQTDVEELRSEPNGEDFVRDDVRLGGAIADTSIEATRRAQRIERLVEENRADVEQIAEENVDRGEAG
jgi:hypothetical protein